MQTRSTHRPTSGSPCTTVPPREQSAPKRKIAVMPRRGENAMDLGLQGKHAIVTGGSRGIGKAIARELAREGVDVAIVARNQEALEATARELGVETNRRIVPLAADVTSKEQVNRMVAEAAQQLGGGGRLANNRPASGGSG